MRRLKILKIYFIFSLFILFAIFANFETIAAYFLATITFNAAIFTVFIIGFVVIMQSSIRLTMLAGTFGVLSYKKGAQINLSLKYDF